MKQYSITLFLILWLVSPLTAQKNALENALFELPDVIFKEIENKDTSFAKVYELRIKQPIDHSHPEKGYFYQRAFLSHKNTNSPMLMYISGYYQDRAHKNELSKLLNANQLSIEHRYFGPSSPDSLDYRYLNLEQATADLHHINELFHQIYKGKWISTGISKGGATTIFYKYFYPSDVDVAIPYVAPINREYEDKRIYAFLDTIGSQQCRKKITAFQKRLLKNRAQVLPLIDMYSRGAGLKFTYLTMEQAFEYSVLEYPFAFWQYGAPEKEIPSDKCPLTDAVSYLMKVSDIKSFSDAEVDHYLSHYYQSATEMGYYGYRTEPFKNDLKALPLQPHPYAAIVPKNIPATFDGSLLKKVNEWVTTHGNRMIYIYGGIDTWTSTGVPPSDKVDARWFILKGKDHATARFANMTDEEKKAFIDTLEKWLSIKIQYPQADTKHK